MKSLQPNSKEYGFQWKLSITFKITHIKWNIKRAIILEKISKIQKSPKSSGAFRE